MTARRAPFFPLTATGDGTTKTFALDFTILAAAHLRVIVNGVLKTLDTDYAVVEATSRQPSVRFFTAPTNGHAIKFYRNTPIAGYSANPEVSHLEARQSWMRLQERMDARVKYSDSFGQTALLAGTALSFVANEDGFIEKLKHRVLKAVTTGGAITVEIDGVAVTGLTTTVADADAAGTESSDTPTTAQSATTKYKKGQTITITPAAAFATAGDVWVELECQPADLT